MEATTESMDSRFFIGKYDFAWEAIFCFSCHSMKSKSFNPLTFIPIQFHVIIEGNKNKNNNDYKSKLIIHHEKEIPEILVDIRLSIRSKDEACDKELHISLTSIPIHEDNNIFLFSIFLDSNKRKIQVNDSRMMCFLKNTLIFNCNFKFYFEREPAWFVLYRKYFMFSADFKTLYDSKYMSDITFNVGEGIFKAHQAVLIARSPVLKAMLSHDCLETKTKTIRIVDTDALVFDCFLKYLYCCEITDTSFDTICSLYDLSEKYDVAGLKEDCREILGCTLNGQNVSSLVKLANLHNDTFLKNKAAEYIRVNNYSVVK